MKSKLPKKRTKTLCEALYCRIVNSQQRIMRFDFSCIYFEASVQFTWYVICSVYMVCYMFSLHGMLYVLFTWYVICSVYMVCYMFSFFSSILSTWSISPGYVFWRSSSIFSPYFSEKPQTTIFSRQKVCF